MGIMEITYEGPIPEMVPFQEHLRNVGFHVMNLREGEQPGQSSNDICQRIQLTLDTEDAEEKLREVVRWLQERVPSAKVRYRGEYI